MNITTTLVHNDNGTPKVVAKGAGKQRTINYDHGVSHERNYGNAAGTLAAVFGWQADDNITHEFVSGRKHVFTNHDFII